MKQMNRTITARWFLLLVALLSAFSMSSIAQLNISVLAGVNNSKISLTNFKSVYTYSLTEISTNYQIKSAYSFFGGMKVDVDLTNNLSISSGLLIDNSEYSQDLKQYIFMVGSGTDSTTGTDHVKLLYLSIPLRLVFFAPLKKSRIYIGVGGYINYGLLGTNEFQLSSTTIVPPIADSIAAVTFSSNKKITYPIYHANRIDCGLSVTAGIQFRNHFFFEAGFNGGLVSVFKDRYLVLDTYDKAHYNFINRIRQYFLGFGYQIK
jgi:hypothetical protein